jgi:tetratricopeptide (TPR) repeat protein
MAPVENSGRVERWHRRARRAFGSGDLEAAQQACQRVLSFDPEHADACHIAGLCELNRGRFSEALPALQKATKLADNRSDYWAQQARCLALLGRQDEALDAAEKGVALEPTDAVTHDVLGIALTVIGRHQQAMEQFEAAAQLSPENVEFLYHFATSLVFCGESKRAEAVFERVLEIDPHHLMSHLALAENLEGRPPPGRIEQLEATLSQVRGEVDRELFIRQALARTLEAAGETSRAFEHWTQSKSAKKAAAGYTIEQDRALFDAVEESFAPTSLPGGTTGSSSKAPIFVVGLPRTGTTLVERILSSHSAITAGGELASLPETIREAGSGRVEIPIDGAAIPRALAQAPSSIGQRYLELAAHATGDTERFVDKQPLNFLLIGFIRRALPNAKIVCLRRNALDTCLANFRHLFAPAYRPYHFALTLEDLAEYFALFTRLMTHWDSLYPSAIYHLQYERLVTDFDAESRRLFDYLELDYEADVANFAENRAPVATASAIQVRKPLYQESVGAWKRYATELEPLRSRLTALGIDPLGYATETPRRFS